MPPDRFASARKLNWIAEKEESLGEEPWFRPGSGGRAKRKTAPAGEAARGVGEILIIPIFTGYDNEVDFLDSSYSTNFHPVLPGTWSGPRRAGNSCQDFSA